MVNTVTLPKYAMKEESQPTKQADILFAGNAWVQFTTEMRLSPIMEPVHKNKLHGYTTSAAR